MKINTEHRYHGAALNQIAEDPRFTAINGFRTRGALSRSVFIVNDDIGIYLKYCSKPVGTYNEYDFKFRSEHLQELGRLQRKCEKIFLTLVCMQDKHICCLPYADLLAMIGLRRELAEQNEEQYPIKVVFSRGSFHVYSHPRGSRSQKLGEKVINRNEFPSCIFQ